MINDSEFSFIKWFFTSIKSVILDLGSFCLVPQRGSTEQLDITSLPDKSCQPGDITEVMPYDSFPATLVRLILDVAAVDMESHRNW